MEVFCWKTSLELRNVLQIYHTYVCARKRKNATKLHFQPNSILTDDYILPSFDNS